MSGQEVAAAARILVIEDDRPIRRFLEAVLTNDGYEVVEADSGHVGLTHLLARLPDLVVLDLGLPDMDGMEIIARVREWSQIPIIILSARGREDDKVDALNAGADDYLTSPSACPSCWPVSGWRYGTRRLSGPGDRTRPLVTRWAARGRPRRSACVC